MNPLSAAGRRIIIAALTVAALIALTLGIVNSCQNGRRARVESNRADAATKAGQDAVNAVGASQEQIEAIDKNVERASDEIRNAKTGDGVHRAVVGGLCDSASYRNTAQCVQQPVAKDVGRSGEGRTDARSTDRRSGER